MKKLILQHDETGRLLIDHDADKPIPPGFSDITAAYDANLPRPLESSDQEPMPYDEQVRLKKQMDAEHAARFVRLSRFPPGDRPMKAEQLQTCQHGKPHYSDTDGIDVQPCGEPASYRVRWSPRDSWLYLCEDHFVAVDDQQNSPEIKT